LEQTSIPLSAKKQEKDSEEAGRNRKEDKKEIKKQKTKHMIKINSRK
jgi:hypothetical protein